MRWISPAFISLLCLAVVLLQREVIDLRKSQLAQAQALDAKAAAAIKQFEADFFAKLRADEKARLAKEALAQAQRNAALQQGLNWLPAKDMDKPVLWGDQPKPSPK